MRFPHGVTVTVQRAVQNRYGDRVWTDHHDITGCAVAPRSSTEANENRAAVIVGLSLYAPTGSDIRATDRIRLPDDVYHVVGQPGEWRSPFTGWAPGLEVALERVAG